jgi:hypothetical protein
MGGVMKARIGIGKWVRARLARFAPRCIVLVIFGDGSFLAATFSRLEPALPRIEIESCGECGASHSACELVANFGSVRIYRLVAKSASGGHAPRAGSVSPRVN